ncbi:trypsin-like peptidase domain-containing protein [Nocardiopsis sp. CC223A]|uniref:VMAP-C domain-containing protein n=1 Tax=Nocardiopsis sp. CC223A TaxID=3044051 RepID=UPI00278C18B5|nr:trypsin-like peptidase domain-containing protein [Nocardiopsis sp. CC223A]
MRPDRFPWCAGIRSPKNETGIQGSAILFPEGHVVTCCHVLKGFDPEKQEVVWVWIPELGKDLPATIKLIAGEDQPDVAVLKLIKEPSVTPATPATMNAQDLFLPSLAGNGSAIVADSVEARAAGFPSRQEVAHNGEDRSPEQDATAVMSTMDINIPYSLESVGRNESKPYMRDFTVLPESQPITEGSSGGPVHIPDTARGDHPMVIGMICSKKHEGRGGTMVTLDGIRAVWDGFDDLLDLQWGPLDQKGIRELREVVQELPGDLDCEGILRTMGLTDVHDVDERIPTPRSTWQWIRHLAEERPQHAASGGLAPLFDFLGEVASHLSRSGRPARILERWLHDLGVPLPSPSAPPRTHVSVIIEGTPGRANVHLSKRVNGVKVDGDTLTPKKSSEPMNRARKRITKAIVDFTREELESGGSTLEFIVPSSLSLEPFDQWSTDHSEVLSRRYPVVISHLELHQPYRDIFKEKFWNKENNIHKSIKKAREQKSKGDHTFRGAFGENAEKWRQLTGGGSNPPKFFTVDCVRAYEVTEIDLPRNELVLSHVVLHGSGRPLAYARGALLSGVPIFLGHRDDCDSAAHDRCRGETYRQELANLVRKALREDPGHGPVDQVLVTRIHDERQTAIAHPNEERIGRALSLIINKPELIEINSISPKTLME